jgi:hypothetical protein
MTTATIERRPDRFDRVDRVKEATGQEVLPGDDRFWILGDPLVVVVDGTERIEMVTGFTTDGASVPDWAQALTGWGPWESPQRWAGITHDWLYSTRGVSKAHADAVLRAVLRAEGAGSFKAEVMFLAVVVGGWGAYRADQEHGPHIFV